MSLEEKIKELENENRKLRLALFDLFFCRVKDEDEPKYLLSKLNAKEIIFDHVVDNIETEEIELNAKKLITNKIGSLSKKMQEDLEYRRQQKENNE